MALKHEGQGENAREQLGSILLLRVRIFFFVTQVGFPTLFILALLVWPLLLAGSLLLALTALLSLLLASL